MRSSNSDIPRLLCLALVLLLGACGGVSEADLARLPGYWEISRVEFPDGTRKTYEVNTSVDYFELKGRQGYRKKLLPNADGTFDTSDDALPLEVVDREGRFFLVFEGETEAWEEELLELGDGELVLRGPGGLTYEYIRYEPLEPVADGPK